MTMKARSKRRPVRPAQIARAIDEGRESLDLYLDEISRVPLRLHDCPNAGTIRLREHEHGVGVPFP